MATEWDKFTNIAYEIIEIIEETINNLHLLSDFEKRRVDIFSELNAVAEQRKIKSSILNESN